MICGLCGLDQLNGRSTLYALKEYPFKDPRTNLSSHESIPLCLDCAKRVGAGLVDSMFLLRTNSPCVKLSGNKSLLIVKCVDALIRESLKASEQVESSIFMPLTNSRQTTSRSVRPSQRSRIRRIHMSQCSLIAKSASKHNNQIRLVEPDRAAFSDRLWRIIRATVALEPVCVADIADCNNVKLTPVSINRYLLMLVRAGIVVRKRKGSYYVYSVSEEHRKEVEKVCDAFHLLERIVGEVECVENAFEDSALEGEIFDD